MKNEQNRALGHLRDLLEDSDLSQREVEERLGWSPGYLSRLLNGRVGLRLRHLEVLLEALGVAPGEYFGALFPPPPPAGRRPDFEVGDEVARVALLGTWAIHELARRVERCEWALGELARSGALERRFNGGVSPARRAAPG